jgi:hypothetical protein
VGSVIKVVPKKDVRSLKLKWPYTRDPEVFERCSPHRLLAHLVGHEGEGSLLSLLKVVIVTLNCHNAATAFVLSYSHCHAIRCYLKTKAHMHTKTHTGPGLGHFSLFGHGLGIREFRHVHGGRCTHGNYAHINYKHTDYTHTN